MARSDTYFKIDETKDLNEFLLEMVKEYGSVRKLAKEIGIDPSTVSLGLNNKSQMTKASKIKIARFFNKDTIEIWNYIINYNY